MTTTEETTEATEQAQEDTSAPAPAEAPQEAPDAAEAESEATEDDDGNPNAEAAKYRKRLRATEAERDQLQEQLGTMRQELLHKTLELPMDVGTLKGIQLTHPSDLFTFTGRSAEDFYNDDGDLDRQALTEALGSLHTDRQELFKPQRVIIKNAGDTPDRTSTGSFRDAFRPGGH